MGSLRLCDRLSQIGRKYFVGMPIPAGAGAVAAVVHQVQGNPLPYWWLSIGWGVFVFAIAFLRSDVSISSACPFRPAQERSPPLSIWCKEIRCHIGGFPSDGESSSLRSPFSDRT